MAQFRENSLCGYGLGRRFMGIGSEEDVEAEHGFMAVPSGGAVSCDGADDDNGVGAGTGRQESKRQKNEKTRMVSSCGYADEALVLLMMPLALMTMLSREGVWIMIWGRRARPACLHRRHHPTRRDFLVTAVSRRGRPMRAEPSRTRRPRKRCSWHAKLAARLRAWAHVCIARMHQAPGPNTPVWFGTGGAHCTLVNPLWRGSLNVPIELFGLPTLCRQNHSIPSSSEAGRIVPLS